MVRAKSCTTVLAQAADKPSRALSGSLYEINNRLSSDPSCGIRDGLHEDILVFCGKGQLDLAMEALSSSHATFRPSMYASLLQACSKVKALSEAEFILQHTTRYNVKLPPSISDYLVVTLAKCGNIDVASHMFLLLPQRTTFSWTAIISGLIDCGAGQDALDIYQLMQNDGVVADNFTYASLAKGCGSVCDLIHGRTLHKEACKKGFDSDIFVSNTFISMYGKCKALLEAENVFCRLGQRTALSWNMLMSSYVEQGLGEETLLCYRQMQHEGVEPDKHTFIFAFQACEICMSAENDFSLQEQDPCQVILEIGETLHAAAYMKNFLSDVLVSTALLRMYGSCGAISEANSVFCALSEHDIIAWNALLSIYQEWGQAVECLQLYGYMWKQGYIPDQLTHMISFQACSILVEQDEILVEEGHFQNSKALEIGRALHIDAERQGHVSGGFVSNAILSMYMKCGEIFETETTFCSFSQRDTVSWSVMILLYLEQKQFEKCFWLYRQMQHEGIRVDHCVLMSVARACGELADSKQVTGFKQSSLEMACLEIGEALHADVLKGDFAANTFLNTTLLSMYSKCGAINKVEHMVGLISQRDTVSWNALLSAYVEHGQGDKVLQGYMQMLRDNLCPDELTFICSLQACGILAENENTFQGHETPVRIICLEIGRALHMDASKLGLISNTKTMTALLTMYGKCGFVAKAENVFLTLPHFDIVSWNAMLSVLIGQNEMENALQLYQVMQRKGMVNDVTLTCILSACTDAGNLDLCQQIHFYAVAARYELINSVTSALIHAYGDCGDFVDAQAVFEGFSKPDSVSWSACLTGCAGKGDSSTCIGVFEELKLEGIKQDEVMFTSVMSACNRAGSVGECLEFFFLLKDSGLVPSLKHYGIVVELLGRAGDFGRLENFLEKMEVKADLTLWMCVLGSCHTHQNVELAKWAFDCVEKLQSRTSMPYVLMSNILVCATECG